MVKLLLISLCSSYLISQSISLIVLNQTDSNQINNLIFTIADSVFIAETKQLILEIKFINQSIEISHTGFQDTVIVLKSDQLIYLKPIIYKADWLLVFDDFIRSNKLSIRVDPIRSNNRQISELLDINSGLSPSTYGGSGTLSELKINGSPANHSIVLIEGIRQNNFQNGSFNLSNTTSLNINQIDIYSDGASAQFGSDAMAGALNLILGTTGESHVESYASYGSYNSSLYENKIAIQLNEDWHFQLAQHLDQSDNYFPYLKNNYDLAYRNGADHKRTEYQAILIFEYNNWFWKTIYKYNHNDSGIPGPKKNQSKPFAPGLVRQVDQSDLIISRGRLILTEKSFLESTIAFNPQQLSYITNHYDNRQDTYNLNYSNQLNRHWIVSSKTELISAKLSGFTGSDYVHSNRDNIALNQQISWSDNINQPDIALDLNLRQEWTDHVKAPIILESIAKKRVVGNLFLTWRYATHFRKPTFNELYWPNAGNPFLNNETGISRTLKLNWKKESSRIELKYSHNNFTNLIVWATDNLGQLSVQNLKKSNQNIWQLLATHSIKRVNFQFQFLHNQSVQDGNPAYNVIPNELIVSSKYKSKQFSILASWKLTDKFPVFGSTFLHPFRNDIRLIADYRFVLNADFNIHINLKINNLLNQYSPPFVAYPQPNRNFDFGIKLIYQLKGF